MSTQRGSALVISLMMLLVLTLLAVSAINISTVNLRIVNNIQARNAADAAAQDAIEQAISLKDTFYKPDQAVAIASDHGAATVKQRKCILAVPFDDNSLTLNVLAQGETVWLVEADYTGDDGSRSTITQGTKINLPIDACINGETP